MTPTGRLWRGVGRTAAVLAAAGIVMAVSYAMTPPYDPKQDEAALAQMVPDHAPKPGSEEGLRRVIEEIRRGQPDYARMSSWAADTTRQQLPRTERLLADFGPVKSTRHVGGIGEYESYEVTFLNGPMLWGIFVGNGGMVEGLYYRDPEIATPQERIKEYSAAPLGVSSSNMALQVAIMLAIAIVGRLALRIRL